MRIKKLWLASPIWWTAGITFLLLAWMSGFFTGGEWIPRTIDITPANVRWLPFHFPPQGFFLTDYWLGQPFYPVSLQPLSLLTHLPSWVFFSGTYPLGVALALLATYAFLRELEFPQPVAWLGAVFYAWQGEIFSTLLAGHFPAPILWAAQPLAAHCLIRSGRKNDLFLAAASGVLIGIMVALLPDRGMLCSFFLSSLFLVELWKKKQEGWRLLLPLARRWGIVVLFAGLLALPDLNTTWRTLISGVHGMESPQPPQEKYEWATQWSFTPEEAITYLIPGFWGWHQSSIDGPYWGRIGQEAQWKTTRQGMRNFLLASFTLGTLAVPVFLIGVYSLLLQIWKPTKPPAFTLGKRAFHYSLFCLGLSSVAYLLALGKFTPLYAYFMELPGMSTWRNPLKFLMPITLAWTPVLACGGYRLLQTLDDSSPSSSRLNLLRFFQGLTALVALLWLSSFFLGAQGTAYLSSLGYSSIEINAIFSNTRWSLFIALACLGLATGMWKRLSSKKPLPQRRFFNPFVQWIYDWITHPHHRGAAFLLGTGILTIAQMLWVHHHYINLYSFSSFYQNNPFLEHLQSPSNAPHRVKIQLNDPLLNQMLQTALPYHGIASLDIPAASRVPSAYQNFFRALASNPSRLFDLAGVRYYAVASPALDSLLTQPEIHKNTQKIDAFPLQWITRDGRASHSVLDFREYLPKALLVPQLNILPSQDSVLLKLSRPSWNPRISLLVDQATATAYDLSPSLPTALPSLPPVTIQEYTPQRIVLQVDSPTPAYLLINDRYDPDWKAFLNDQPASLFPANYLLRGLALPSGPSTVLLEFTPPTWPVYVQLMAWSFFAIWGLFRLKSRHFS